MTPSTTPNAYKNSRTLKNLLGIRDFETLEAFELEMTTLRANEPLPVGDFSAAHYRAIHRFLFQDVYRWAGEYRTVRTSKGGNPFCFPEHIASTMAKLFRGLEGGPDFGATSAEDFVAAAAVFLAELNAIHPFREGNGRSQLAFLHLLGDAAGYATAPAADHSQIDSRSVLARKRTVCEISPGFCERGGRGKLRRQGPA